MWRKRACLQRGEDLCGQTSRRQHFWGWKPLTFLLSNSSVLQERCRLQALPL